MMFTKEAEIMFDTNILLFIFCLWVFSNFAIFFFIKISMKIDTKEI